MKHSSSKTPGIIENINGLHFLVKNIDEPLGLKSFLKIYLCSGSHGLREWFYFYEQMDSSPSWEVSHLIPKVVEDEWLLENMTLTLSQ